MVKEKKNTKTSLLERFLKKHKKYKKLLFFEISQFFFVPGLSITYYYVPESCCYMLLTCLLISSFSLTDT